MGPAAGASLSFSPREEFRPNGLIRILVPRGGARQEAAQIAVDERLRTRTVDLSAWLSGPELAVRFSEIGAPADDAGAPVMNGSAAGPHQVTIE